MLRFVMRKMFSKKWMVLALLIGNILLVSITAGNPMYTQAVLQRTLTKNLEALIEEKNTHPGLINLQFNSGSYGEKTKKRSELEKCDAMAAGIPADFGLGAVESVRYLATTTTGTELDVFREDAKNVRLSLSTLTDMADHIELVGGSMYSAGPDEEGIIDVIVSEAGISYMKMVVGDVMTLPKMTNPQGEPLRIRIAGVFRNKSADDLYWVYAPSSFIQDCFMDPGLFEEYFMAEEDLPCFIDGRWHVMLDYAAMRSDQAQHVLNTAQNYAEQYNSRAALKYSDSFSETLADYLKTAKKVNVTLWVLQVPIFMLLAAFIFMVSRQMLDMERDEIAVIKSRGAGRSQILAIYLIESIIISALAYALGVPLGVYLCQVVGSSNAFLEFVRRSALPVEIDGQVLTYAAAASVFSVCTMVFPAFVYSNTSIVNQKRSKNRKSDTPMWQKLFLDVILLGVAMYGLYSFNGQKEILAARVQQGASLDPLLFLSSSIFMIGAGLLAVRLMPIIVWMVFRPFKRFWSPALYASFLRVLRNKSSHSFIVVFLIMTIALGIFNAQAARTINQNSEDNIRYSVGADIVVQEKWLDNSAERMDNPDAELVYYEPDFGKYEDLEGHESIAKVYVSDSATVDVSKGTVKNVQLMGIHTKDFGETAWFKDSLLDTHWYNYLNTLSKNSRAVLVSQNFRVNYGCDLGDSITYRNREGELQRGVIYGFVDFFPGYVPVSYRLQDDGLYREIENYLVVAHLQQLQSSWGVEPYEVWFKNSSDSAYIYDMAQEEGIRFEKFEDAGAQIVASKNDPVLQGTNGILTVGFIVVLILCSVGFLIYWILSIKSRSLQFGIFRAMGMSMGEVILMLLNEQLYISGLSIVTGAVVGHLTAKLYMPLIQIAYAASDNALPLELISRQSDNVRLFAVVGIVMLVCMIILAGLISRMKIAQALKLGED
ncbi:MAG: ABC transporter permease [Clostridia bacterium]|nr:ABC transporter permease [Clostridia bacterium]